MKNKQLLLLVCITLLAFFVRLYNVTNSPEGLYIDETSIGYNAWSLLETGKDEHGTSWPIFFEAFGEYKLPLYIYATVITQFFLGPTDLAVRLPAILFGTLTVFLMYWLTKELLTSTFVIASKAKQSSHNEIATSQPKADPRNDDIVGLLASLGLALSPWHFQFTHAGFEASGGIFFFVLGTWLCLRAARKQSLSLLIMGLLSWALTLYTYNSARIVIPVVLVTFVILFFRSCKWWYWLIAGGISLVILIPFLRFSMSPQGLVRAQQVSIVYQSEPREWVPQLINNYLKNISPETLFVKGEPTIAHLTPHRMSLLHLVELPGLLIGLVMVLLKPRRETWLMFVWLLIGFVPPAITTLNPHALRASFVIPALAFVVAYGIGILAFKLQRRQIQVGFVGLYVVVVALSFYGFLTTYHTKYTVDAGWDWQVDIKRVGDALRPLDSEFNYYFTEAGAGRISYLWYLKYPPKQYAETFDKLGLRNIHFGVQSLPHIMPRRKSVFVMRDGYADVPADQVIVYPNEYPAFFIYEY